MKCTRRQILGSVVGGLVAGGAGSVAIASSGVQLPKWGDAPAGSHKAGPLGLVSGAQQAQVPGQVPVSIVIPAADVDAEVERTKIVDGQMLDPSGPWIVAWYEGTALAGEIGNAVMSGHVDYWDVGPAVFRNIANLSQGSEITLYGADGGTYTYGVEYIERIEVATLTQEKLNQIVGPTDHAAVTLITCGGEFNYDAGEYYERDIIRARILGDTGQAVGTTDGAEEPEAAAPAAAGLVEGGQVTVAGGTVNVRADATTASEVVGVLSLGTTVTITGASREADGYVWWPITADDGTAGWVVEDFLTPAG